MQSQEQEDSIPYACSSSSSSATPEMLRRASSQLASESEPEMQSPSASHDQRPCLTPLGIRLGTPVAREAAKSFWSMDMLRTSLNRIAFYADCDYENHSETRLLSSRSDSGYNSSVLASPTPVHLPPIAVSAPPSPVAPTSWREGTRRVRRPPSSALSSSVAPTPPLLRSPPFLPARQREGRRRAENSEVDFLSSPALRHHRSIHRTLSVEGRGIRNSKPAVTAATAKESAPLRRSRSFSSFALPVPLIRLGAGNSNFQALAVSGKKLIVDHLHNY